MRKKEFKKITGILMVIALFACIFTYRVYADEPEKANDPETQENSTQNGNSTADSGNQEDKKEEEKKEGESSQPADTNGGDASSGSDENEEGAKSAKGETDTKGDGSNGDETLTSPNEKKAAGDAPASTTDTPAPEAKGEGTDGTETNKNEETPQSHEVGDFIVTGDENNFNYENGILTITGDVSVRNRDGVEKTNERIVVAGDATVVLEGINIETGAYLTEDEFTELTSRDASFTGLNLPSINKDGVTYLNASFNNDFSGSVVKKQNVLFHNETDTHSGSPITINPGCNAILELKNGSVNTVKGFSVIGDWNKLSFGFAGIEVGRNAEVLSSLTITGEGSLNAYGGYNGAGIGGTKRLGNDSTYGDIIILSGNINAHGGSGAAGIGSGSNPDSQLSSGSYKHGYPEWGKIVIGQIGTEGPAINSTGTGNGAGIGGGNHMDSGEIIINSGNVEAIGDSGIGSGLGSSNGEGKGPGFYYADVTINGGTIKAFASNNMGAGIGGGMYGDAFITITGGDITSSVSLEGKDYQGGAGIGGGYQGVAVINITGGKIVATGGNGSAGIGNGALGATTTTKKWDSENGIPYDIKEVRYWNPTIKANDCSVTISGGDVFAYGGSHGAGIGSGNASEWSNVVITGGNIYAQGGLSSETEMEGGAGIGSGSVSVYSKKEYSKETDVNISITGGTVLAVGGWGAAGIGSSAGNKMANYIMLDNAKADIEAYADGTKFAIDTRDLDLSTQKTTSHKEGRTIDGYILQGTFVHNYIPKDENGQTLVDDNGVDLNQKTEGLNDINIIDDMTGARERRLTKMPVGYRSFAATVSKAGTFTVYTDSEAISNGGGRYFAEYWKDVIDESYWSDRDDQSRFVQYEAKDHELCDNFYLYPVKSIVVDKEVVREGDLKAEDLNTTVYFAIREKRLDANGNKDESEELFIKKDGEKWIQSIKIINGVPQNKVYFTNVEDKTYEILEVDENGKLLKSGIAFGETILKSITTRHGDGTDNDGVISKTVWTDRVTVINTYYKDSKIDLVIRKILPTEYKFDEYNGTTVIFKVTVKDSDGNQTYENYAGISLDSDSARYDKELGYVYEKTLKDIPFNSTDTLDVEEVYSAGYLGTVSQPVLVTSEDAKYYRVDTVNEVNEYVPGTGAVNSYHDKTHVSRIMEGGGQ